MTASYSDSDSAPADGVHPPTPPRDTWLHHLLDTLGWPALLLDAERTVVAANPAAGRLQRDALVIDAGRLTCEDGTSDQRLARAVRELLGRRMGSRSAARRRRQTLGLMNLTRDRIVFVTVALLEFAPQEQGGPGPLALVTVHDPQTRLRLDTDGLADLFALSPAELRVAEVLVDGHSPAIVAQLLSLSEGTVRTHLRAIFKKTGTHRQAELVRLLTRFWYP